MKLSRCGRRLYLLLFVELIVSATASYVQVKFYYKDNNQGTGQSWNSFTPKDGSCGPCTDLARLSLGHDQGFESMTSLCDREVNSQNMGSRGNTWGSYKITEGPPDTSIILFESYSCHGALVSVPCNQSCCRPGPASRQVCLV